MVQHRTQTASFNTPADQVIREAMTRKNLILRLVIPRFLTQGDTAPITGIVHNYLAWYKTAEVSLEATGVELPGDALAFPTASSGMRTTPELASQLGTSTELPKPKTARQCAS